jgi:hypothetical protein
LSGGFKKQPDTVYYLDSAEEFDPGSRLFIETSGLSAGYRVNHTATLLGTGQVLVAGGRSWYSEHRVNGIYVESTGSGQYPGVFWRADYIQVPRSNHVAVRLRSSPGCPGAVLVAGGVTDSGEAVTDSAEIFGGVFEGAPPYASSFQLTEPMAFQRFSFTATLLNDGRVLVAGGLNATWPEGVKSDTAEIFELIGECN